MNDRSRAYNHNEQPQDIDMKFAQWMFDAGIKLVFKRSAQDAYAKYAKALLDAIEEYKNENVNN